MKLITEAEISSEIKRIFADADEVKVAVAFWGKGGLAQLGGLKVSSAQVICNLDSGACNPSELAKVGKVCDLKTHEKLHAKIYWTPKAVIIGSSNASTNGLWGELGAFDGWREANILSTDPTLISEVKTWFGKRWNEGRDVTAELLDTAKPLWKNGHGAAGSGSRLQASILDAFLESPDHPAWDRVKVAFTTIDLSDDGEKDYQDAVKETATLKKAFVYEGWPKQFAAEDVVIDVNGIDAYPSENIEDYTFKFALAGPTLIKGPNLVYLWPKDRALVLPFGSFTLSSDDKAALLSIFKPALALPGARGEGGVVLSLAEAVKMIKRAKSRR